MTLTIILIICALLLIAYLFDLSSARTKIPSVILLLILGWAGRQIVDFFSMELPDLTGLLPVFGVVGLILIVLEGALELDFNKSKFKLIRATFFGSFISMMALTFLISYAFQYFSGASWRDVVVNAIPLAIISSSVAISSARNMAPSPKEFVIYESSLSDIMGVLFFNFMIVNTTINGESFAHFGLQILIVCAISFVATLALSYLLKWIDHPIKHAPIIILLILIYAVAEIYHLPALIFILFFGLFLGNIDELKHLKWIKKLRPYEFNKEVDKFRDIVAEGAFLIRAFFFTLFGYSFETREILNPETFGLALIVFTAIFVIRAAILRLSGVQIIPLLFVAPRGLITILLFFSIPAAQTITMFNKSLIVQVIILTSLFMMIGLMATTKEAKEEKPKSKKVVPLEDMNDTPLVDDD